LKFSLPELITLATLATAMRVSQSSISHQLRLLQKHFVVKLYDRVSKESYSRMKVEILQEARSTSEAVLSALLAKYQKAYPLTKPSLLRHESRDVEQMLLRSEIDIGFVTFHPNSTLLAIEPFSEDEVVPFASFKHPLGELVACPGSA
jgi:DNA-binding transcriptional LysR family regulator